MGVLPHGDLESRVTQATKCSCDTQYHCIEHMTAATAPEVSFGATHGLVLDSQLDLT
jgi:hypothetical protein